MEIDVINIKNEPVEKLEIPDSLVGVPSKPNVVYEVVRQYQAKSHQGTAATKTRGLVSGSGRKLWRQKGTGRARIGSVRSPLWRHGGTVFGPQPRDYSYTIPAKKRLLALRSVFSQKVKANNIIVVDEIQLDQPKTKAALELIATLKLDSSTLFIDDAQNKNLQFAVKNLPKAKFSTVARLNIVDALKYKKFVISKEAFNQLTQILAV
jgi:large subunit ribosomal protein L4